MHDIEKLYKVLNLIFFQFLSIPRQEIYSSLIVSKNAQNIPYFKKRRILYL